MKKILNVVALSLMLFFVSCEQGGLGWKANGLGYFSVSSDKQVAFSPSNLSYNEETRKWSFLENQLERGYRITGDLHTRDLFTLQDLEENGYQDWGVNIIGNDAPDTWRTLTKEEWEYLLFSRKNASDLYGYAVVEGDMDRDSGEGLVLLPDDWECPDGVVFLSGLKNEWVDTIASDYYVFYSNQHISYDDWEKMEKNGAVLLQANTLIKGGWDNKYVGRYFTSTMYNDNHYEYGTYILCFDNEYELEVSLDEELTAVRLVKDL